MAVTSVTPEASFAIAWLQQLDLRLQSARHLLEQAPHEGTCGEYKQGGGEQESELQVLLGCGCHGHGPNRRWSYEPAGVGRTQHRALL